MNASTALSDDGASYSAALPHQRWSMLRNCSVSPRQLAAFYLSISALSLLIALAFLWQGMPYVLGFTGIELIALGAALLVWSRHARDGERLWLDGDTLHLEQRRGTAERHWQFLASQARLDLQREGRKMPVLTLQAGCERIAIGGQLEAFRLEALRLQIQQALRETPRSGG